MFHDTLWSRGAAIAREEQSVAAKASWRRYAMLAVDLWLMENRENGFPFE